MISLLNADAGRLALADEVVHCIVCSPPYMNLRRYAGEQLRAWPTVNYSPMPGLPPVSIPAMEAALGLEPTVEAYIGHLLLCFRECYRVLRDDGCMWVVMGDSYTSEGGYRDYGSHDNGTGRSYNSGERSKGLPAGNLLFVPHRLAMALQGDGWIVRNDCVWHKVAPMPESVAGWAWSRCRVKIAVGNERDIEDRTGATGIDRHRLPGLAGNTTQWSPCPGCPDCEPNGGYILRRGSWRHTRAHEVVLMAVKSMGYWADQEAVRENLVTMPHRPGWCSDVSERNDRQTDNEANTRTWGNTTGRNPRSVLTPRPASYPGSHYATFPPTLIEPLIRATCPTRCCPRCGSGWAAVVEKPDMSQRPTRSNGAKTMISNEIHISNGWADYSKSAGQQYQEWRNQNPDRVIAYRPTCTCGLDTSTPGLLLDPFVGSGTSLLVARKLGLRAVGCDLSAEYLSREARTRLALDAWDAWHEGSETTESNLSGLPLFEGVNQ